MMLLLSRYSRAALVVSTLPAIFRFPGDFVKVKPVILLIFRCCRVAWAAATDDEFPRKHVTHHAAPKRSMTWWQLGGFAYVNICGGPFGMESAVNAGGALLTLVTIGVLSVCWAMPQALMTAEMSTAFPVNGGLIVWINQGLGRFCSFWGGFNSVFSNILDLPIYPVLFAGYVGQIFPHLHSYWLIIFKFIALAFVMFFNIKGLKCIAVSSVVFTCIIIFPFIVEMGYVEYKPEVWQRTQSPISWAIFMSSTLWNFQGFDTLGSIAGEVKNGKVTYPLGVMTAILLIALFYLIPIMVGTSVDPNFNNWDDGYFVDIANRLHPWLGYMILIAACVAMLSQFNASMTTYARVTQSVSVFKMLPEILSWNPEPFATPVPAIVVHGIFTGVLMNFSFQTLVVLDAMFKNVSLCLEFVSFLVLKHRKPDLLRPYEVPGGIIGAWLSSLPAFAIVFYAYYSVGWGVEMLVWFCIQVGLLIGAWLWMRLVPESAIRFYGDPDDESHNHPMIPVSARTFSQKSLPSLPDYFEAPKESPAYAGVPMYRPHNPDEDGIEFEAPHVKAQLLPSP